MGGPDVGGNSDVVGDSYVKLISCKEVVCIFLGSGFPLISNI